MVALGCAACGESSGSKPNTAVGGSSSGGGNGSTAGSMNNGAGTAGNSAGAAGASGGGTGVGMCSGSSNQTPGGRIKAKYWVTSEGDRAWEAWWDTQLNAACDFNPTSDGVIRCIPENWDSSREYFTDDQCTQALYTRMQTGPCDPTDYIMQFVSGTCEAPGGYAFNKLGAQATPTMVYQKFGDNCMVQAAPIEPLYAKGAEVPPTTFMEATPAEYGTAPRIKTRGYATNDGTKYVTGWRDSQLGNVDCYFQLSTDGNMYCLPQGGASVVGYSDAACSTPVLEASTSCNDKLPEYAVNAPNAQCGDYSTSQPLKRGEAFATAPYVGTQANCTLGILPEGRTLYQSTPAPLEPFQKVVDTIDETDPGRLKPRYYDGGSAGCWFHNFWDSELQQACSFATTSDMKERCIPSGAVAVLQTFSDAACTVPAALSPVDDCTPATLPVYTTTAMGGECGRGKYQVWKVGEQVAASTLPPLWRDYGTGTGGCLAYQPTATDYIKLSLVDPTTFMAGEPVLP